MQIATAPRSTSLGSLDRLSSYAYKIWNAIARRLPTLRDLRFRLSWLLHFGICKSGRHFQADTTARSLCCDGFRHHIAPMVIDGRIARIVTWRCLSRRDPYFVWEGPAFAASIEAVEAAHWKRARRAELRKRLEDAG